MVIVYDLNMSRVAVLQNAFDEGYEQTMNELWTAQFSLPGDDPKNEECQAFRYVEFFDGDERVDLFRILPYTHSKGSDGVIKTYQCEHVLGTLIDDVLFQYHQTDNLSPADTINYILSKQTTPRWQLGTVEFTDLLSYKWENENLLSSLFSIPKAYIDEYMFTWNTETYPWTLNLIRPSDEISAYIRYRKNLIGIEKEEDPTYLRTRLYALGYGEGVNQLTIESVNGGLPYIDSDTVGTYGIIADFYIDKTEENVSTLKAKTQALLEQIKYPRVTYSVDAADIYQITQDEIDKFILGAVVQVYDEESGIEFAQRVVKRSKPNYSENPGDVKLEIANKVLDITDTTTGLQRKQRVSEVYSQGATNIDSNDYHDNCDATHPAIVEFYIPKECVNINKCLLSYKVDKFRAYERSTLGGGGQTSSPSSTNTTGVAGYATLQTAETSSASWNLSGNYSIPDIMSIGGSHNHGGYTGTTQDNTLDTPHSHSISANSGHAHGILPHSHGFTIPDHQHGMQHTHTVADHTHGIEYGIFEFSSLPDSITITVDGNIVNITNLSETDIDIIPYLSKDSEGKINRGVFHKVEITPNITSDNPLGLSRIIASVIKMLFVQSRANYSL